MIKDFQTKQGRLKRNYKADFSLADSDDFYGFQAPEKQPIK